VLFYNTFTLLELKPKFSFFNYQLSICEADPTPALRATSASGGQKPEFHQPDVLALGEHTKHFSILNM